MSKYLNLLEQHNIKPVLLDSVELKIASDFFSDFNNLLHECDLQNLEASSHMRKLFNQNRTTFNQRKIISDMNDLLPLANFTLDYMSESEIFEKNNHCKLHFDDNANLHESYMYLIYKRDDSNYYNNAIEFNLKCNIHFVQNSLYIEYRDVEVFFVNRVEKLSHNEIEKEVKQKAYKQIEQMLLLNIIYHISSGDFCFSKGSHKREVSKAIQNNCVKKVYAVKVDDFLTNSTFVEL